MLQKWRKYYDNGAGMTQIVLWWISNVLLITAHYVRYHTKSVWHQLWIPFRLMALWNIDAHSGIQSQESLLTKSEYLTASLVWVRGNCIKWGFIYPQINISGFCCWKWTAAIFKLDMNGNVESERRSTTHAAAIAYAPLKSCSYHAYSTSIPFRGGVL